MVMLDIVVCGHEVLSYGDSGDHKHWLYNYEQAPGHIDISDWFDYYIPWNSHDDCVNHDELFYTILDRNCEYDISGGHLNTIW